jgi:DNA-binding transcriptional ArsR family regulator
MSRGGYAYPGAYKSKETLLLRYLGASPTLRIIDFFLDNSLSDYSKNEVVKNLEMSRVTFFKYWKELEKSGAVRATRQIGRATMYRLDRSNDVVKQLVKLDMTLSRKAMERAVEEYQKPVTIKPRAR